MSDERRRKPRIPIFEPAVVRRLGEFHPAQLIDLSAHGAHFETDTLLTIGEPVRLELTFPWANMPLNIEASVVRVEAKPLSVFTAAAEFCRVHPDAHRMIELGVHKALELEAQEPRLLPPPPSPTDHQPRNAAYIAIHSLLSLMRRVKR